jgi:hypothetical protein
MKWIHLIRLLLVEFIYVAAIYSKMYFGVFFLEDNIALELLFVCVILILIDCFGLMIKRRRNDLKISDSIPYLCAGLFIAGYLIIESIPVSYTSPASKVGLVLITIVPAIFGYTLYALFNLRNLMGEQVGSSNGR